MAQPMNQQDRLIVEAWKQAKQGLDSKEYPWTGDESLSYYYTRYLVVLLDRYPHNEH